MTHVVRTVMLIAGLLLLAWGICVLYHNPGGAEQLSYIGMTFVNKCPTVIGKIEKILNKIILRNFQCLFRFVQV